MGWSSGSKIMTEIIETLMETIVDEDDRAETYSALIDIRGSRL
jgi:hypothetical protein